MKIKKNEFDNIKYLKDPQTLYELMISSILSSKDIGEIKKNNSKILLTPSENYFYTGSVQSSGYHILSKNKKIKKIIVIDYNNNIGKNKIILPLYEQFETPFGELHTIQDYKYLDTNFEIEKDNFYFDKNSRIEIQLPFIKGILNIEYFLPIIISKKCDSEFFEEILKNIYQNNKDIGIVILGEQGKGINIEKEKILINHITNLGKGLNNFVINNNLDMQPISFLKNKGKIYFSLTI